MNIHTLHLGIYQANCYILWQEGQNGCIAIDPGGEPEKVTSFLEKNGLHLEAILLTHGHFDHVGGVEALVKSTGCVLWMREGDYSSSRKDLYPLAGSDFTEILFYEEGEELTLAGLHFSVMETPGHTWGSVCLFVEDSIFSGDTLFAGSIGRTDLEGGDDFAMAETLQRLAGSERDYKVYPGHGPATTLDREKACNPYMR